MTDTDIIEAAGDLRVRLEIQQDSHMYNPRTNQDCNLTNVITPRGQRYIDVDKDGGPLAEGWDRIHDRYVDAVPVLSRWARIFHGIEVFEDRPHDGAWSLWYVTPGKLAEVAVSARAVVEAEIAEYRDWTAGEVYAYVIERAKVWTAADGEQMTTWETEDSCGGYIGRAYAEQTAREEFAAYRKGEGK